MDLRWIIFGTSCIVILLVKILYENLNKKLRQRKLGKSAKNAPYFLPFGLDLMWRVVSHMRSCTFFEFTREILDVPGRTVQLNMLGGGLVLTDEPENIKAVMLTKFSDFGKGKVTHEIFKNVLGDSVFSSVGSGGDDILADGPLWVANKNQLRPYLAQSRPNDLTISEYHIQRLFRHLHGASKGIEVYDVIDRLQLDIVTHVFFGESTGSLDSNKQPFRDAMDTLLRVNTNRVALGRIALLFPDWLIVPKATRELSRYMDSIVDKTLSLSPAELRKREQQQITLMEALAIKKPDRKYIKDQLISVLLAGKDPVAILTTWAIFQLSRHPEMVKKLQDELQEKIGLNLLPDSGQIKTLTLLRNVVKETMRMYHPLGLNIREAKNDTCLPVGGGLDGTQPVAILKGQQVVYSVLGVQRSQSVAREDADEWNPSRWETWTPGSTQYLPFNIGPRICLGRNFGQLQIEYTLARILQEFETIEWCGYGNDRDDNEEMRIKIELNTKFDKPVICKFIPRRTS